MEFSGLLGVDGLFKRIPAAHIVQQPWQIRQVSNGFPGAFFLLHVQ